MADRDATQVLIIMLRKHADLIVALLRSGALSPQAAQPLAFNVAMTADMWTDKHPDLAPHMSEALADLQEFLPGFYDLPPLRPDEG